jgi:quercetin dioxygenase-like cupin family protein
MTRRLSRTTPQSPTGVTCATLACSLLVGAAALAIEARAEAMHEVVRSDAIEWQEGPDTLPPGAEIALLHGDPYAEGVYALRVKLPPDYVVPPHFHPRTENVTVLEGTLYLGMGETFDRAKGEAMGPGAFLSIPPDHAHAAWTEEEPAVFQLHAEGPYEIHYIDPDDDPRS